MNLLNVNIPNELEYAPSFKYIEFFNQSPNILAKPIQNTLQAYFF